MKLQATLISFILLSALTLYYKIECDHLSAKLLAIQSVAHFQEEQLKKVSSKNSQIEKQTVQYRGRIINHPLSEDCQKSLQFIFEEMK